MTALLEKRGTPKTAYRKNAPDPQKNALWDFFESSTYSTTIFDNKTQCSRLENHTFTYDTAPGVRYYGYRYYSTELGRWVSRDPIGEMGGVYESLFIGNNPIGKFDLLGLLDPNDYNPYDPIAMCNLQQACSPGVFGSAPAVLPYCASIVSVLNRPIFGIEDLSPLFTDYYETRFPGTTEHAKTYFRSAINREISANGCSGNTISLSGISAVEILGYMTGERVTPSGAVTEAAYGDVPQNELGATQGLGNYTIELIRLDANKCNCGGCSSISWSADIAVLDRLGVTESNLGVAPGEDDLYAWWVFYSMQSIFGPQCKIKVAKWTISGEVCCE